ncbi:exopolyphosphatase PRUNE1 isoform X2 [Cololabis saira]|uniref:exopolyphosphatase PRUNE1 isoform X1 n=1 Tax=Cololabis saira TaxID=129043 RepID=UPI002AD2CE2A|nr:exopolyphosphatase PRUNE1 isoform X1 [Cololabis saira]XP_061573833.1 exopolyphosphatase PRUNE1 isoform X2 [Cololabis saira]
MEEFLRSCGRSVKDLDLDRAGPPYHVVLGNEACDLDSMVSALAVAYFLSKTTHQNLAVLPVLNIRHQDLVLRSDNLHLLDQTGLDQNLLLFRDQLDLQDLQDTGRLTLTLVDHNVLPRADSGLEGAVVEVIDHHVLEREPSPSCPVTMETVGSCATLVTERILREAPGILDQQLAHLLYAAVVVDCVNMAPAAGKVTPKDSQVAAALETRFPSLPPRGALFTTLSNAKFDVSGLNVEQMLLKDMKVVTGSLNVAISVLYITLEEFLKGAGLEAELSSFCQRSGFDLLVLMTISFSGSEPNRDLGVFSTSTSYREQVSRYLEQTRSPALDLRPISSPHSLITAFHQGNALASRKKLLPLVKDFLSERAGGACCPGDGEGEEPDVPPTPMNSLVDGCPLDGGLPRISSRDLQDLQDRFGRMGDA